MNKQDMIYDIAERAGIPKADAEKALNAFTDMVMSELGSGNDVVLVGFGTWSTNQRAAREGRNPKTGEAIQIPASVVTKFKPGKKLKDAVNKEA